MLWEMASAGLPLTVIRPSWLLVDEIERPCRGYFENFAAAGC